MHLCKELSLHVLMAIIACKLAFVRTRKQMDVVRKKPRQIHPLENQKDKNAKSLRV